MKPLFLLAIGAGIIALPIGQITAATFLPTNSEVTSVREEVADDIYGANNSIVIAAPIRGDIFAAGNSIDISGSADESIFAVGRTINVSGSTGDDVRAAGSMVSVSGAVAGDMMAAGSVVTISEASRIGGDVYIAGEEMTISGTIAGDVRFAGNRLTITESANIAGNVTMYSTNDPVIEDGATIGGNVSTEKPAQDPQRDSRNMIAGLGRSVFAKLALALALLFAAPVAVTRVHGLLTVRPLYSFIIGAVWIILLLPIGIVLLVSGIGTYIGLLLLFGTAPLLIASLGISLITIGALAHRLVSKTEQALTWQHPIFGALIIFVLSLLGGLGFLVAAIVVIGAFGATLLSLWSAISGKK